MRTNSPCKSYLDRRWRAESEYHSPSLGLFRERDANFWLSCTQMSAMPFPPCGCWVITGDIVILWQGVKGSRLHLPAGGMAGEKKGGGRWRTGHIDMRGILFHFDCSPAVFLYFSLFFLICFSPPIVYSSGLEPVGRIVPLKLLVLDLTSFHWLRRWPFLYVEHEEMCDCMHMKQTDTLCPLSVCIYCRYRWKCSPLLPQGHCFACDVWWLSFSILFLLTLSLNILLFFHRLLISIQRNHQAYTIESFFFFFTPRRCSPSHPLTSLSILHCSLSKLCLLTKGAPMFSQIGVEMGSSAIDKFHPRGDNWSCLFLRALSSVLSSPSNLTQTLHRKSGVIVKRSKPSRCFSLEYLCLAVGYLSCATYSKKDLLLMYVPQPGCMDGRFW